MRISEPEVYMTDISKSRLAKLSLLIATFVWGTSFVMMKSAVTSLPVLTVLGIRFSAAFVVLAIIFGRRIYRVLFKEKQYKKYLTAGCFAGVCLFCAYSFQSFGLAKTTPGKNAFLTAVYCVIVPFLFWAVDRRKPTMDNVVAALICIAGIGFVSLNGSLIPQAGDALTLVGGLFYAFHIIVLAKTGQSGDPIVIAVIQFGVSAVFAWAGALVAGALPAADFVWDGGLIFSLCYLSFGCTAFALLMQSIGQKYTSPSAASIILSLESVFGVMFSVILHEEVLSVQIIAGFVLIFGAVLLSELQPVTSMLRKKRISASKNADN